MEIISFKQFSESAAIVFSQPMCIRVWLGHGLPIFMGFGDEILPEINDTSRLDEQREADFGFTTHLADWWLSWGTKTHVICHSECDRKSAEAAISRLVGQHILHFKILKRFGVRLHFSNDLILTVKSYRFAPDLAEDAIEQVWHISEPDGLVSLITRKGLTYRVGQDESLYLEDYQHRLLGKKLTADLIPETE